MDASTPSRVGEAATVVMTLKVYRVDGASRRRREVYRLTVPTGDPERLKDDALVYPPCACPRCRVRATS